MSEIAGAITVEGEEFAQAGYLALKAHCPRCGRVFGIADENKEPHPCKCGVLLIVKKKS